MMRALAAAALALAACATPPLTIELAVLGGSDNTCTAPAIADPKCTDVPLACASMVLIRILDPNQPLSPYISSCEAVVGDSKKDLCSIATLGIASDKLPASLPERTLEVQVVVLPLALGSDGLPDCDDSIEDLQFAVATGVLQSEDGAPSIGGRAYYHPGDATTTVELGCNDLAQLNAPACVGTDAVTITASVDELDTQIAVSGDTADLLTVAVGEPISAGSAYVLNPSQTRALDRVVDDPPSWSAAVDLAFTDAACLDVLEDGADTTPTLTCTDQVAGKTALDLTGMHVSRTLLAEIVSAIQSTAPAFTLDHGLVVGVALDSLSNPVAGVTVAPATAGATVLYLSADGTTVTTTGTSANGIFLSTDAPFLTTWTTPSATGFGGLVDGKVTVVVLQTQPTHN